MTPLLLATLVLAIAGPVRADESKVTSKLPEPLLRLDDVEVHRYETTCNTYVITCRTSKHFVVVDPGTGVVARLVEHESAGGKLAGIWITHEHGDHLSALGDVAAKWKVPVVSCAAGKDGIETTIAHWNMWWPDEADRPTPPAVPDTLLKDGQAMRLGKTTWKIRLAPGHCAGGMLYLLGDRLVVTGDVLFRGSVGRMDLPSSDVEAMAKTLSDTLWDLPDAMVVLPGHMPETTIGHEKKTNWLFQDLVRRARKQEPIPRPWMGINLDVEHTEGGVRLAEVVADSPAAKAGLEAGDVLLTLGGTKLAGPMDLRPAIAAYGVGDTVEIELRRGEETKTVSFTFGRRPEPERPK